MRKIGAIFGITALAAVVFPPLPATAFGIHVGPFYFRFPLVGHHYYRHHQYMRTNPNEARTRPNDSAAKTDQTDREARTETSTEALESCTGLAPGVTNLPIDQIRQTVHPTADQKAALDDFSEASSQASDVAGSKSYRVFSRLERTILGRPECSSAVSKPLNTHGNFEPTVFCLFEKCHMPKNSKVNAGFYKLLISNQF